MNEIIIKTENLRKELSIKTGKEEITNVILPDLNLEIFKGEFTSITGPSGSGKTTLLYLLGGMDKPTSGRIFLDGEEITKKSEEELTLIRNIKLGFVYQFHFLLNEFTALENVTMPIIAGGRMNSRQAKQRGEELLSLVGMEDKMRNKPTQLSGGQQQRVAIARALANEPKVLLADEPTGNLDSKNSELVYNLFKKLNEELKQTIVVVTHDEGFAQKTRRNIHLVDGKIV